MKKLLAFVLVLALCLSLGAGLAGCVKKETASTDDASGLNAALEYVKTLYKNVNEKTTRDFKRIGTVPVNGTTYEVVWSVDVAEEHVKVVKNSDGTVTIDVNETSAEDVPYTLTATISAGGKVVSFSWKHLVPKVNLDFGSIVDEAYALEQGATMDREVTLTGVISKIDTPYDEGYKNITVTMNVIGVEGKPIQAYRLKGEGAETLKVGDTITVTGTITNYQGKIQFQAGCTLDAIIAGEAAEAPTDIETILKEAFALADGGSTKYEATLTGKITKINTPYNPSYKNVSVTIAIEGYEDKELLCYRIKGDGADSLLIGDTITVKGYIVNYKGSVQFGEGSALLKVEKTGSEVEAPSDPKQIVKEAYELKEDETLPYKATLTGKITKIDDPYNPAFGNITVTIVVSGMTDKPIKVFRLAGKGVENVDFGIGDTITVTGQITNYKGEVEFAQGCTLDKWENTVKDTIKELTVKEAIDLALSTEHNVYSEKKYKVTGTITEVYDAAYGNMKISDAQGNILTIYGSYSSDGSTAYKDMASKPVAGDIVTIMGPVGNYNGTPQIKNGWILSFETPEMPSYAELGLPAENEAEITIEQALAAGKKIPLGMYTENKYKVTGVITEVKQTTYGNLYIEDAEGNTLYIYGTFNADGSKKYGDMDVKPIVGDTITVLGILGNYKGDAQMKNGNIIDHKVPEIQLEVSFDLNYDDAGEAPASFKVNPNTAYGTLPTPIREGYKFISWHKDKECATEAVTPETTVTESHTLYAKWEKVEAIDPDVLAEMQAIVDAAFELEKDAFLDGDKTLTGKVVLINTPYNEGTGMITVTIAVEGREQLPIMCYGLAGTGADALGVGDTITVTGKIKNYSSVIEFDGGCTLDDVVKGTAPTIPEGYVELVFDADKANRVSQDNNSQVWAQNGITLVNQKAASNTNVNAASAPVRFYKNSDVTITYPAMEKIVFTTDATCYAVALVDTISGEGVTVTRDGLIVTVEFAEAANSLAIVNLAAQARVHNIKIYAGEITEELEKFEVSFVLGYENAPAAPEAIQVIEGNPYGGQLPADPTREGYTFGGWFKTPEFDGEAVDASTPVTESHILYAKWIENSAAPENPTLPETDGAEVSIADVLAVGATMEHNSYTTLKYKVTGVITQVYNTQYGNMYIEDAEGNTLTIYGTYNADGTVSYNAMDVKPVAGDTVTIYGPVGQYSGTPQIKNGWIVAHTVGTPPEQPDVPELPTEDGAEVSIADALLVGATMEHNTYTELKYKVTGVITEVNNTQYGNMYIQDAEGNKLTIYGTYDADGTNRYDAMDVKPVAGDTVTVYGIIGNYNGAPQMKNGWIVAHTPAGGETPDPEPEDAEVIFDMNCADAVETPDPLKIEIGGTYGTLPDPDREGYIFYGWYKDAECTGDFVKANDVVAESHTLYAKWVAIPGSKVEVIFDMNCDDDVEVPESLEIEVGGTYGTLPDPDREGYIFYGWYKDAECTGDFVVANAVVTESHTLYAKWVAIPGQEPEPEKVEISFNLNYTGAPAAPEAVQITKGSPYGTLPTPTREGYTFGGWFLDAVCYGEPVDENAAVGAPHTLYAKWTENSSSEEEAVPTDYTITFDNTTKRTEISTNKQVWKENGITITHNKGTGSNIDGQYFNPIRFYKNSNFVVECSGKEITKIVFNANSDTYATSLGTSIGTNANYTVSVSSKVVTVTFIAPVESFTVTLSDAKAFVDSITVTALVAGGSEGGSGSEGEGGETPAPEMFNVTFDLNGAEGTAPTAIQVEEGKAYGTLTTPTREGYTFGGWFKTEACDGNAVKATDTVSASHTLYAKWTENSSSEGEAVPTDYTITFDNTTKRTEISTTKQVWKENGITVTNNKGTGSDINETYYNPVRFYKNSNVVVECSGKEITKIVFNANNGTYATSLGTSIGTNANYTVSVSSKVVTVTFIAPVESFTVTVSDAKAFVDSITVTALVAGGSEGGSGSEGGETGGETGGEPPDPTPDAPTLTTPAEIIDAAYALATDTSLDGTYTLTGKVTSVKEAYNDYFRNVSVWMIVEGKEDKPILCYRLSGTGADVIKAGYTITVTGSLTNFKGTIEFAQGCTLESYVEGSLGTENMTPAEIVDAAYALAIGETMLGNYTLTGKITNVDTPYSTEHNNITVTIAVEGKEDKPIKCYRMKGTGADVIAVGDTITVSGVLKNYNGTIEFDTGCSLDSYVKGEGSVPSTPTGDHVEPSSVTYTYKSNGDYSNVVVNWGIRGDVATSLSPMATAFYTGENTFANLSAKTGSATLSSVPQSDLYVALKTLMASKHTKITTYGQVRYLFGFTDCEKTNSATLSLFYCANTVSSTWDGNAMNREHCWPKSLTTGYADDEQCNADIMTLRPTLPSNNSARGNKAYGTTNGTFFPNTYLDSKYDLRGDCARIVLYTYVRWNQTNLTDVIESVDTLLSWIQIDPVDTWELARNDSVQSITGTRNVFVDYPELAFILFGEEVPTNLVTPAA